MYLFYLSIRFKFKKMCLRFQKFKISIGLEVVEFMIRTEKYEISNNMLLESDKKFRNATEKNPKKAYRISHKFVSFALNDLKYETNIL